jgi:hypothetical protein
MKSRKVLAAMVAVVVVVLGVVTGDVVEERERAV